MNAQVHNEDEADDQHVDDQHVDDNVDDNDDELDVDDQPTIDNDDVEDDVDDRVASTTSSTEQGQLAPFDFHMTFSLAAQETLQSALQQARALYTTMCTLFLRVGAWAKKTFALACVLVVTWLLGFLCWAFVSPRRRREVVKPVLQDAIMIPSLSRHVLPVLLFWKCTTYWETLRIMDEQAQARAPTSQDPAAVRLHAAATFLCVFTIYRLWQSESGCIVEQAPPDVHLAFPDIDATMDPRTPTLSPARRAFLYARRADPLYLDWQKQLSLSG